MWRWGGEAAHTSMEKEDLAGSRRKDATDPLYPPTMQIQDFSVQGMELSPAVLQADFSAQCGLRSP